jgi:hypothetical protein
MLALGIVGALLVFGGDDVGTVEIRTTPSVGAAVVIDGTSRGSAPLRIERLPAGPRTIEIRADGYETATRTVMIQKGAVAMLEIALTPAQAPPRVASAAPAAAQNPTEAAEEDSESARGPPADDAEESDRAERNKRTSEQRTEGTRPTKVAQTERAERTRRDTRTPRATERPRTGSGTLVINAIPWARVFIDGRDTGRNTPVPSMRVRSGRRTIGLRTADGQMHDFSVDVPPGETVRLMKRL